MSSQVHQDQARRRVKEIVAAANGEKFQAERLIRAEIDRDPRFLRSLVEPFLSGIIAHALSHGGQAAPSARAAQPAPLSATGMETLLKGMERSLSAPPDAKSSELAAKPSNHHAATIKALAAAQAKRRKDER